MVSKILPRRFQSWACPQKIETDELQALLDINSAQNEKEFAEQLDVTQQAVCLHTMGKGQKMGST